MIIGSVTPKEVKNNEYRVALTPAGAAQLKEHGHTVLIEQEAGSGSGFSDEEYRAVGASIMQTAAEVWGNSDMIMKVKEPIPEEFAYFRRNQIIFTYLHLAAAPELAHVMLREGVSGSCL